MERIDKVINEYTPRANRDSFDKHIPDMRRKHGISNISKKTQCYKCPMSLDTKHETKTNEKGEKVIELDKSDSTYGKNHGFMVGGQNVKDAHILFVGTLPNSMDTESGIPYSSPSVGDFIRRKIRSFIYRTNISSANIGFTYLVKCRNPLGGDPRSNIIKSCQQHILKELNEARPYIIVPMGKLPANFFINFKGENNPYFKSSMEHHGAQMLPCYFRGTRVIVTEDPTRYTKEIRTNTAKALAIEWRIENDLDYISKIYKDTVLTGKADRMKPFVIMDW